MPDLTSITKLSEQEAKKREAAFEAEMLALLSRNKVESPVATPVATPSTPPTASPAPVDRPRDGIQVSVTENGQTTIYQNLEAVPSVIRNRMMSSWRPSSQLNSPPVLAATVVQKEQPASPTRKPPSWRAPPTLNLILPRRRAFYLGRPLIGTQFAIRF